MSTKGMPAEERESRRWEIVQQFAASGEISDDELRELGLLDWMKEDNSIGRMRLIVFSCMAVACTIWVASGLVAFFVAGNTGMFLASPLIVFPVYKTVEYFIERYKRARC